MATLAQYVSDFLRDAQYRIAEITIKIDGMRDEGNEDHNFITLKAKRKAIIDFMELLYDPYHLFADGGYNFLSANVAWTEREIKAEIEYLRDYADMTRIPYGVFTGYYPTILNNILGDEFGANNNAVLPQGDYLEILRYNSLGQLEAVPFPQFTGMGSVTINDYFAGRL